MESQSRLCKMQNTTQTKTSQLSLCFWPLLRPEAFSDVEGKDRALCGARRIQARWRRGRFQLIDPAVLQQLSVRAAGGALSDGRKVTRGRIAAIENNRRDPETGLRGLVFLSASPPNVLQHVLCFVFVGISPKPSAPGVKDKTCLQTVGGASLQENYNKS